MTASVVRLDDHRRRPVPVWSFADRIRKVRRDGRMTQAEFAEELGVGEKRYSAWESGLNVPDDLPNMCVTLEAVTGVPRTWFLGWDDAPPSNPTPCPKCAIRDSNPEPAD